MFEGLFLASQGFFGGVYGGGFGEVLAAWEQAGVFSYILPFLLIFAMVFGILTKINLFGENKTINAILALTVGLLSLQFSVVPFFFSEIFPRVGVGLSIILIILIFTSMFSNPEAKWQMYLIWAVSAVIVGVIIFQTFAATGFSAYWPFFNYYGPQILGIVAIVVILAVVVISARPGSEAEMKSPLAQMLRAAGGGK
jgi:hypothetical protein